MREGQKVTVLPAIVFDAVGTLIHPSPSVAVVYARVGQRHGSRLDEAAVAARFRAAFREQERLDARAGNITSEDREYRRWVDIVAAVLNDVVDAEACFRELYNWFALPQAWRCVAGTSAILEELTRRGHRLALASNFDHRLRSVVAGLPELRLLDAILVSSEVGYRKPHPKFFGAIQARLGLEPASIVYVGDDPDNDFNGAQAAGMRAILIEKGRTLRELLQL
jgi:putative hydrolase of the HAD superfamily